MVVTAPFAETGRNIFEVYYFAKPLIMGEETVRAVLFFSADFSGNPALIRFWEHAVRIYYEEFESIDCEMKLEEQFHWLSEKCEKNYNKKKLHDSKGNMRCFRRYHENIDVEVSSLYIIM